MKGRERERSKDRGDEKGKITTKLITIIHMILPEQETCTVIINLSNLCHPIIEQFGSYPSLRKQVIRKRTMGDPYRRQLSKALCLMQIT